MDDSSAMCNVNNDAVPAEVDETQSHVQPVVVKQEPDDVCCTVYVIFNHFCMFIVLTDISKCFSYLLI